MASPPTNNTGTLLYNTGEWLQEHKSSELQKHKSRELQKHKSRELQKHKSRELQKHKSSELPGTALCVMEEYILHGLISFYYGTCFSVC